MVGGKKGYVNVFDFNSKKWEENHPGIPELFNLHNNFFSRLSSSITFNKDAKQKLMVLIGKFCLVTHTSSVERFSGNFDKKAVTYLIFFVGTM